MRLFAKLTAKVLLLKKRAIKLIIATFVLWIIFFAMLGRDTRSTSWQEFEQKILRNICQYRGLFVQETVIDWHTPLFQRPQQMALALEKLGYLVIYKTKNARYDQVDGYEQVAPGIWLTNRDHVDTVRGAVRSFYSTDPFSTTAAMLKRKRQYGPVIYEYVDHIAPEIFGSDEELRILEEIQRAAFECADYIVATAVQLRDHALSEVSNHTKVLLIPNGVDVDHYRNYALDADKQPLSLARLRKFKQQFQGLVGYFGAMAPWLWYDMIEQLVQLRPDLGFVFIGPDYNGGVQKLPKKENVLYLGTVEYKLLPAYASLFDIAIIPFAPGPVAQTTSPLKLFEYFALEKPVVATSDMLECIAYPEVLHGASAVEFAIAIDRARELGLQPDYRRRLRVLADRNTWLQRAGMLTEVFSRVTRDCPVST